MKWMAGTELVKRVLGVHLSKNEYLPVLRATPEERLFLYRSQILMRKEKWEHEHEQQVKRGEAPQPGTKEFMELYVTPVISSEQQKAFGPSYLLTTSAGWRFLNSMASFVYYRNGRGMVLKMIDKIMKPPTRAANEPRTVSDVSVIIQVLDRGMQEIYSDERESETVRVCALCRVKRTLMLRKMRCVC